MHIYNTAILLRQNMSEQQQNRLIDFYTDIFSPFTIQTVHDCSIGAGGTTLPLAKMGLTVSGSDLSQNMLTMCRQNFESAGYTVTLDCCDLRELDTILTAPVDCLLSTGNSLPHVPRGGVVQFVQVAAKSIRKGGLLFIDMRNWDKLLAERPRIRSTDPKRREDGSLSCLHQIFNWHDDHSVNFGFATVTYRDGRVLSSTMTEAPRYYPLERLAYESLLTEYGFHIKGLYDLDTLWMGNRNPEKTGIFEKDFQQIEWYGILAQKQ